MTNVRTGVTRAKPSQSFQGAHGYERGQSSGRLWALQAKHLRREEQWKDVLRSLPGEPVLVISDNAPEIHNAVAAVWPNAFMKLCEHHLYENAKDWMKVFGLTRFGSPGMELLNDAFKSPAQWRQFRRFAKDYINLDAWAESLNATVLDQSKRRTKLPAHHSTGALDPRLAKVRATMLSRAYCYRNAERTNRMHELMRLRLNFEDDRDRYASAIREHLNANGGRLGSQDAVMDQRGHYSLLV